MMCSASFSLLVSPRDESDGEWWSKMINIHENDGADDVVEDKDRDRQKCFLVASIC